MIPFRSWIVALSGWLVALGLGASHAVALENTAPSRAPVVQIGVPFMGGEANGNADLWRLGQVVRQGDSVQVAVDNSAGDDFLYVCLMGPTDDFGYQDEANASCYDIAAQIHAGSLDRVSYTYSRATGFPFIRVSSLYDRLNNYAVTVERIVTRVNLGIAPTTLRKRRFSLSFIAKFGDNSQAADGIAGTAFYRYRKRNGGRTKYKAFVRARTEGGKLRFRGVIPKKIRRKKPQLRFCVTQPGGGSERCASTRQVKIRLGKH